MHSAVNELARRIAQELEDIKQIGSNFKISSEEDVKSISDLKAQRLAALSAELKTIASDAAAQDRFDDYALEHSRETGT